jgi:hypothetical protein
MSARSRKRSIDARQCRLAKIHIALSMPGWSFSEWADDLDDFLAESTTVLAELQRRTEELMAMEAR